MCLYKTYLENCSQIFNLIKSYNTQFQQYQNINHFKDFKQLKKIQVICGISMVFPLSFVH